MKIINIAFVLFFALCIIPACTLQGDDGADPDPAADAGTPDVDADNGDEVPPPESAAWPCRGGKDSDGDYFECNPSFMDDDDSLTPTWVGDCSSESVSGYWSGAKKTAQLNDNGWWRLYLQGTASSCELTVSQCSDTTDPHCWMQYGTSTITDDAIAGPYRWCDSDCAMKLQRNADHTPTPLGN